MIALSLSILLSVAIVCATGILWKLIDEGFFDADDLLDLVKVLKRKDNYEEK